MKRTLEISSSFTGAIPTGNFENQRPFFSVKEIIEDAAESLTDEYIGIRQKELHDMCYNQFKQQAELCKLERIAEEFKNLRFYDIGGKTKYPSVTSIIGWDTNFHMPDDHLAEYGARGTIIHKQCELYLMTGEWREAKDMPEIYPELVTVKKGTLGLLLDDTNFRGFYKDYPFKTLKLEQRVYNTEHKYAGRVDVVAVIESSNKGKWDKVEGVLFDVPTVLDFKTGSIDKTKALKQQTAYWHCIPEVQQVGLIHLNNKVKSGFSKPIIETNEEKYWSLFLKDRQTFKKRYGV